MTWNDVMTDSDSITSTEWNQMVNDVMLSATALANFYPSALGKGVSGTVLANTLHSANSSLHSFSVDSYMTSANIITNYMKSTNALANFYPSTLGNGVSSNVKILDDWYEASSAKLSDYVASGDEYSSIYASGGIFGEAYSWMELSGQNYSDTYSWYTESSSKLGDFAASGDEYSAIYASGGVYGEAYTWMEDSGAKYTAGYESGQVAAYLSSNVKFAAISSTGVISGSWTTPIYRGAGKPTAGVSYEGQIIRTSGGASQKTYVWICVINDAGTYEWIQLGLST